MRTILVLLLMLYAITAEAKLTLGDYQMSVRNILKFEEGFRSFPYLCSEGYITIGYGTKLHKSKGMNPLDFSLVVSEDSAYALLKDKVEEYMHKLQFGAESTAFRKAPESVKQILISMTYQMGYSGILSFKVMWYHLRQGDYVAAATAALDSKWATQTPARAGRHAQVMATGNMGVYDE